MRYGRLLRDLRIVNRGVSAIEFALVAGFLSFLCIGVLDFGRAVWEDMEVGNAARAGADYASTQGWNSSAIQTAVTNATPLAGISATPAPSEFYGCPNATSGTQVVSAGTSCADGTEAALYASVTAQASYTPILPYPGIASPMTFSATSIARLY